MDNKGFEKTLNNSEENSPNIDLKIPEKTLKILRAIGKGNGLKEDNISFEKFTGQTFKARAQTTITLNNVVAKTIIPGRDTQGKIAESEQDLQNLITRTSNIVTEDENTAQKIKDIILKREDQGFALKGIKQKLHNLKKHFCLHKPCTSCGANGKIGCTSCNATGKTQCSKCYGKTFSRCMSCQGDGRKQTPQGQVQCVKCHGRGQLPCTKCHSRGQIACHKCGATGKINCHSCTATGWITDSVLVEQEALFMFHVNQGTIPAELAKEIELTGAHMLQKHDLETQIVELDETEKSELSENQLGIAYNISIPYGNIHFKIKDKTITSTLIGYQGRMKDTPPYMEDILQVPIKQLKQAAIAPSTKTEGLLKRACKARMIRDILKVSAEQSQKNGLKLLLQRYPYGVEKETFKTLIKASRKSFLDLTRSGRYKGLAAGLVLATIISALYYFILRNHLLPLVPNDTKITTTIDSFAFLIGLASNLYVVQLIGKQQLSKNLYTLLGKTINVRANQVKTGKAWIWSVSGNILIFIGLSWLAARLGYTQILPLWLTL